MSSLPKLREWTKEEILEQIKNGEVDNEFLSVYISKINRTYNLLIDKIGYYESKYDKALEIMAKNDVPCEIDGFMDKNVVYCSMNCGVDEVIFKKCWDKFIEQKLKGEEDEDN